MGAGCMAMKGIRWDDDAVREEEKTLLALPSPFRRTAADAERSL